MKKIIIGIFLIGLTSQLFAQEIKLPEVIITAVNYKYLNAVDTEDTDISVKALEEKAALYNIKLTDMYDDEYDTYTVSFYIPSGSIVAAYDKDGKILRTIEKFKNAKLPDNVRKAVLKRFPNWTFAKDVYHVSYDSEENEVKKMYKIKLTNGDEVVRVKTDENGNFL